MTRHPISCAKLGTAYGVTAERARQLTTQFGFDVVADPDRLFAELIDHGNKSRLRTLLQSPHRRAEISNQLKTP